VSAQTYVVEDSGLTIRGVQKTRDEATYTCIASNVVGNRSMTAYLTVNGKLHTASSVLAHLNPVHTVAENGDCRPFGATVAVFAEIGDYSRQCGQAIRNKEIIWFVSTRLSVVLSRLKHCFVYVIFGLGKYILDLENTYSRDTQLSYNLIDCFLSKGLPFSPSKNSVKVLANQQTEARTLPPRMG